MFRCRSRHRFTMGDTEEAADTDPTQPTPQQQRAHPRRRSATRSDHSHRPLRLRLHNPFDENLFIQSNEDHPSTRSRARHKSFIPASPLNKLARIKTPTTSETAGRAMRFTAAPSTAGISVWLIITFTNEFKGSPQLDRRRLGPIDRLVQPEEGPGGCRKTQAAVSARHSPDIVFE